MSKKSTETTTKFKVDISELKSELQQANREILLTNAKFKESVAGMEKWEDSADGVSAKITQLTSNNQTYSKILADMENQLDKIVKKEGEDSEAAANMQIKITNLKAAIKGNNAEIEKQTKHLDEMGKKRMILRTKPKISETL